MALEPIGDIADPALTENTNTTTTITWKTATDWNNATTQTGVVHESVTNTDHSDASVIKMGYSASSPYKSASSVIYTPLHEDSGSTAYDFSGNNRDGTITGATVGATAGLGTTGYSFDGTDDYVGFGSSYIGGATEFTVNAWLKPDYTSVSSPNWRFIISEYSWGGPLNFFLAQNGGSIKGDVGGVSISDRPSGSVSSTNWQMWTLVYDGTSNTDAIRLYKNATLTESSGADGSSVASNTLNYRYASTNGGDHYWPGDMWNVASWNVALTGSEIQALYDVVNTQDSLETATKSFSSQTKPDLQNLSYSLNGESITLDVIGSPGTSSEEVVSQTLDGTTSFSLSWTNSHTDFRLRPKLSTATTTATPTFNRGELVG